MSIRFFWIKKKHWIPLDPGTGIFTYIYPANQPNVGKYTSPMDLVGTLPWKFNMDIPIYHTDTVFFKGVTLLETNISPTSRHFRVDDCPNFPVWWDISDSSLKGTIFSIHVSKKIQGQNFEVSRFQSFASFDPRFCGFRFRRCRVPPGDEWRAEDFWARLLGGWLPHGGPHDVVNNHDDRLNVP